jgi:hypothetical protein
MQAIRTRYHGPTNTRPSRMSAHCAAARVSVPVAHELNLDENHKAACDALRSKLKWDNRPMIGGSFDGDTYWVFTEK